MVLYEGKTVLRLRVNGEARITIASDEQSVSAGQMLIMPADIPHAIRAEKAFKMMLVMVRS